MTAAQLVQEVYRPKQGQYLFFITHHFKEDQSLRLPFSYLCSHACQVAKEEPVCF